MELGCIAARARVAGPKHHHAIGSLLLPCVVTGEGAQGLATINADSPVVHTRKACACRAWAQHWRHAVAVTALTVAGCSCRVHCRAAASGGAPRSRRLPLCLRRNCAVVDGSGGEAEHRGVKVRGGGSRRERALRAAARAEPPVLPPVARPGELAGSGAGGHGEEAERGQGQRRGGAAVPAAQAPQREGAHGGRAQEGREEGAERPLAGLLQGRPEQERPCEEAPGSEDQGLQRRRVSRVVPVSHEVVQILWPPLSLRSGFLRCSLPAGTSVGLSGMLGPMTVACKGGILLNINWDGRRCHCFVVPCWR
mmetsp:Transcript_77239/g.213619  ORF Transcript_77239/g.213619 Transcript_77239/m.213619 type:complete len:309 (-) Transcript_77239:389-1315(-)